MGEIRQEQTYRAEAFVLGDPGDDPKQIAVLAVPARPAPRICGIVGDQCRSGGARSLHLKGCHRGKTAEIQASRNR